MLYKSRHKNFTLHIKGSSTPYHRIFADFVNYRLSVVRVFRNQSKTKVMLIEHDKHLYVLKVFKPNGKKIERLYKSWFKKDYSFNLIKRNDELWERGMRFQNDVYLLARRKKIGCTDLYVMLFEYIPGKVLNEFDEIPEEIKQEIVCKMALLHHHKLVSGDAHKGNFILSAEGLRIIDLSGKNFTRRRVAEDQLMLERYLNINNIEKDVSYHLVKTKSTLRKKIKNGKKRVVNILN